MAFLLIVQVHKYGKEHKENSRAVDIAIDQVKEGEYKDMVLDIVTEETFARFIFKCDTIDDLNGIVDLIQSSGVDISEVGDD